MNMKNLLDQPFWAGFCACMCILSAAGRPAPGRGTAARRAVKELGAAGPAVTPSLTQKQRGTFTLDLLHLCREIHPEKLRAMGATHITVLTHSSGYRMDPQDRDGGPALPGPQDKQQTAYDIPNIFSSN